QAADSKQWLKQFVVLAKEYLQLKISNSQDADRQYLLAFQKYCIDINVDSVFLFKSCYCTTQIIQCLKQAR
ncbi:MAG: hypothetical protein WAM14_22710, partial [Candidatus Nitrosopolaris sp.]